MTLDTKILVSEDYLRQIEKKTEALKVFIEVSTIISSTLDLDELMPLVMEKAKDVMDGEACSILFYDRKTNKLEFEVAMCKDESTSEMLKKKITLDMGQGIAGWVAEHQEPLVIEDAQSDERFFRDADKMTGFLTKSLIAVPLIGRRGLIGVAEIVNPRRRDYDQEIFKLLCRQFAIAIENALFHKESLERERMRQEIEIASALQKSFLPPSPVLTKGNVVISAITIPAEEVGGDIYDFIELGDDKMGAFIGDVSGKGISAALYMAKIISDLRYIALQTQRPEDALGRLNSVLSQAPRGMFVTGIYAHIDMPTGNVSLSVAGHPPFLWLADGEVRIMNVASGPPLGIMPSDFPSASVLLGKDDRLLFLTDGVFDAKNREGKRLGFNNLVEFIRNEPDKERLLPAIADYVKGFSRGSKQADDLTMLEIHRRS